MSTGDSPVPSGDSPDGTRTTIQIEGDTLFAGLRCGVPLGASPSREGDDPFFKRGFETGSKTQNKLLARMPTTLSGPWSSKPSVALSIFCNVILAFL